MHILIKDYKKEMGFPTYFSDKNRLTFGCIVAQWKADAWLANRGF
jgi:hypothetical protein